MNVDEREREQKRHDLEVEIVDLPDEGREDISRKREARHFPRMSSSVRLRPVTRQRRLQLVLTAAFLALVFLVILGSSLPVRILTMRLFSGPTITPTAPIEPRSDLFYISGEPSWGKAYLDGKLIAAIPRISHDAPLRIGRGHHVVEWRAEPFQEQRCQVSVPPDYSNDTCHYNDSTSTPSGGTAWLLSFPATLQLLPDGSRQALLSVVHEALDARQGTELVRVGELYNGPAQSGTPAAGPPEFGTFNTAQQALYATLRFQLDTDPLSPGSAPCTTDGQNNGIECMVMGEDCHTFCTDPLPENSVSPAVQAWDVLGVILPTWYYTTLDGKIVALAQPDAFAGAEGYETLLPLHIVWTGNTWQVSIPTDKANALAFGNPYCISVKTEVALDISFNEAEIQNMPVQWSFVSGADPAAGCVAVARPNPRSLSITPPASSHVAALCLQRFGVLLAANELAHQLWPLLPMADAYEQQLAQKLAG